MINALAIQSQKKLWRDLSLSLLLLLVALTLSVNHGSAGFSLVGQLFSAECWQQSLCLSDIQQQIIVDLRLPRAMLAFAAGAGLAISGTVLQSITRNPLADPYLFGLSSGASLGAVFVLVILGNQIIGLATGAFLGSLLSIFLVTTLAGNIRHSSVERLLLSGVAVSFMLSALTSLILYLAEPDAVSKLLFWMLGSFSAASWQNVGLPTVVLVLCFSFFFLFSNYFNALLTGEETAATLGVDVAKFRLMMLLVCSLLTAVIVANCGGIGFVGLMIPHIVRKLFGARTQSVLLFSALTGGSFMLLVDLLARMILPNQVLPVGILTSILGSGFFFVIMKYNRRYKN